MVALLFLIISIEIYHIHHALAVEQRTVALFDESSEQGSTMIGVPLQSVLLPCQAILPHLEPERVMWYKLTPSGQSPLSVGNRLITKDSRLSVAHYSVDHGRSPARWDLHISNVRLSDAADYQCHCAWRNSSRPSSRSTVKLIVQDILVDIQPIEIRVSTGDSARFSCYFTGKHPVRAEDIAWLQDDQPVKVDAIRVITATQLINMTVSHLHIATSRISDSGSYRCSDGNHAQSREARLYLQDLNEQILFRSLSSSSMSNSVVFLFSFSVSLFSLAMFGEIY